MFRERRVQVDLFRVSMNTAELKKGLSLSVKGPSDLNETDSPTILDQTVI